MKVSMQAGVDRIKYLNHLIAKIMVYIKTARKVMMTLMLTTTCWFNRLTTATMKMPLIKLRL